MFIYSHIVYSHFIMPIYFGCVYKLLQNCLVVRGEKLEPLVDFPPADAGEWLLAEVSFWGKLVASRRNHACSVMTDEGKVNLDIISVYIFMEKMDDFPSPPLVSNHPVYSSSPWYRCCSDASPQVWLEKTEKFYSNLDYTAVISIRPHCDFNCKWGDYKPSS